MSKFERIERKTLLTSHSTAPGSCLLQPTRPLAPKPISVSEAVTPGTQKPPALTRRFGYSFAHIPLSSTIQRKVAHSSLPDNVEVLGSGIQAARGGGQALDKDTQQHLEQGLDVDLSNVRIHTDANADRLAHSVNALAFTTGNNIFFSSGMYHPNSPQGLHLLAHETTHVRQQMAGSVSAMPIANGIAMSDPGDCFEQSAEMHANQIASGRVKDATRSMNLHSVKNTSDAITQLERSNSQNNVVQRKITLGTRFTSSTYKTAILQGLQTIKVTITSDETKAVTDIYNELDTIPQNFTIPFAIVNWIKANVPTVTGWLSNKSHTYTQDNQAFQEQEATATKKRKNEEQNAINYKKTRTLEIAQKAQNVIGYGNLNSALCEQLLRTADPVKWHLPPMGQATANALTAQQYADDPARNKFTTVYEKISEAAEDLWEYLNTLNDLWEYDEAKTVSKTVVNLSHTRSGWDCHPGGQPQSRTWQKIEITMTYRNGALPIISHFTPTA